jgi:hypothetical protein
LRMDEYTQKGVGGRNAVGANVELGRELVEDAAATGG